MTNLNPEERFFGWPHALLPTAPFGDQSSRNLRIIPDAALAEQLGCDRSMVRKLRAAGLDYWWADRLATRVLCVHPSEVWPNWRFRSTLAMLMVDA